MKKSAYIKYNNIDTNSFRLKRKLCLGRLDFELTERCNNNCVHCCVNLAANDLHARQKELSTEEIKDILAQAASVGYFTVRFTGGEPLLRNDFETLYVVARKLGLKVLLFTNAILITPHLAKLFRRIPPIERIEVSIYGMKESSYEATTRVLGSYEAAWRGINLLFEYKIPFIVKNALLPENRHEVRDFEAWAATIPWMNNLPRYTMFFNLRCRINAPQKNELIKKLRVTPDEGVGMLARDPQYLPQMRKFCAKFMRPSGNKLFTCKVTRGSSGCVDAYGYFYACMMCKCPATSFDLKQGSLHDALRIVIPAARRMKAANPTYLARCAKCFLHGFCEQCPAQSWMEYGTLDTQVEYYCDIAHTRARHLGLLGPHEKAWEVRQWRKRIEEALGGQLAMA